MTKNEIEECKKKFNGKYKELKIEVIEFVKKERIKKKELKKEQQIMYDFIIGKREIAQFERNNEQYFLKRGDEEYGFKHIVCRHYGENVTGKLNFRDILNIYQTLSLGREATDVELTNNENKGFIRVINEEKKLKLFYKKDGLGNNIITYCSTLKEERFGDCL